MVVGRALRKKKDGSNGSECDSEIAVCAAFVIPVSYDRCTMRLPEVSLDSHI